MIGERLKSERERLGLNQTDFGAIAGVKKGTIINWEKDDSSPTTVQLFALAAQGVDVQYVQTGRTKLERRLDALKKVTDSVVSLPIPEDKQIILRDILYATEAEDYGLLSGLLRALTQDSGCVVTETMADYAGSNLTVAEKDLLSDYRKATQADQEVISRVAQLAVSSDKNEANHKKAQK